MALNQTVYLQVAANAVMSPINIKQGQIQLGNGGIAFHVNLGDGFIDIPWREIDYVSVEIVFGFFYRGIIVKTKNGQNFEFVTSKTKKILAVAQEQLAPEQIRQRTSVMKREKAPRN